VSSRPLKGGSPRRLYLSHYAESRSAESHLVGPADAFGAGLVHRSFAWESGSYGKKKKGEVGAEPRCKLSPTSKVFFSFCILGEQAGGGGQAGLVRLPLSVLLGKVGQLFKRRGAKSVAFAGKGGKREREKRTLPVRQPGRLLA